MADLEYRYILLDTQGGCREITDEGTRSVPGLSGVLGDGWVPVRETPLPVEGSGPASVLILLERDPRGRGGFGFAR